MALDFESCAGQAFVAGVRDAERALLSAKDILLKQKQVVAVAQIQQAQGTCCYVRAAFLFDTTSAAIWYDEANRHFLAAFGVLNQELEDKYKNYEHPCASFAEQVKKLDKEDKNMFLHETIIRSVMPCTRALRLALADCAIDLGISFGNRRRTIGLCVLRARRASATRKTGRVALCPLTAGGMRRFQREDAAGSTEVVPKGLHHTAPYSWRVAPARAACFIWRQCPRSFIVKSFYT
jgi:hypothetical protein